MNEKESQLTDLREIRSIMERNTRFISLSGFSGISAGLVALASAYITHRYLVSEGVRRTFEYVEVYISPQQ